MAYYNNDNRGNKNRDFGSWVPTLIMLICFPPVGIIMLIFKMMGLTGGRRVSGSHHPYDIQQEQGAQRPAGAAATAGKKAPGKTAAKKPSATQKGDATSGKDGKGLTIAGAVIAAIFGFGGLGELLDAISYGWFWTSLSDIFIPLGIAGIGLVMLYLGLSKGKRAKRWRKYLALIGKRESISVEALAKAMGLAERKVYDDLQDILDEGILPDGYLDLRTGRLVLSDEGLLEDIPTPAAPGAAEEPAPAGLEREDAVLTEIREVNDAIADEMMSHKIDRIGEITGKIFAYLREKPDKEGQLRSFLSYYLPTTLKILRAYAQMEAQGIQGTNINSAKARIEGMMDKVVDGFEKQLDKLFQDDAMDITTDVAVLERMLEKDGLGEQGMTMGGT